MSENGGRMKITLEIDDLDYGSVIAALLPMVHEKFEKDDGSVSNKILAKLTALSPSIAKKMVNLMPKDTQNEIVVLLINKNKEKILDVVTNLAKKKEVSVQIGNLEAEI
jgi:hypothetical protein